MLILSQFFTSIPPMDSSFLRYLSPTALRRLHEREKCQLCPWRSVRVSIAGVKFIEQRKLQADGPIDYEYYVHYTQ
ncbi:hypothetical protein BUALT_Bualt12G0109800 [Buddleja alternifolia]|uniref:Uncharacterized protein n=1 Tax=Buddleja alternifolia TaxID=168488 RepID=A0AAV6X0T1_9LAMI|nr:hypothetical protein BUALT_Bualt12G0109800 [Buddleja alternifolia]